MVSGSASLLIDYIMSAVMSVSGHKRGLVLLIRCFPWIS